MTDAFFQAIQLLNLLVLGYFLLLNSGYLVTTVLAVVALRRHARRAAAADVADVLTVGAPPITLIAPAYNEEATCVDATTALLSLVYPEYEVLVVNDGSRDRTLDRLAEAFDLHPATRAPTADLATAAVRGIYRSARRPNLWVIDKENGGKADALNVGINHCGTELFCALDADTLLERDALARIVRPFLEDARTMAAGGIIRIVNDSTVRVGIVEAVRLPRKLLARFQVLEYLRAFLAGRTGWDVIDAMLIISGAFGLFRRSLVVELGGYATDTVGEDMELVVRIHRHCLANRIPYRVTFIPDPVAWTECPESVRVLGRQRDRWQRGLMQVLWRHRVMLLNPRYGRVGMLAFPYFFFLEGWGPLIEIAGYLSFALALVLGTWTPLIALAFFALAFLFGAALSVAAVGLEELSFRRYERWRDLWALLALSALEPFGYRQLSSWWRARGVVSALRGVQQWGAMERKGFKAAATVLLAVVATSEARAQERHEMPNSARASYAHEAFLTDDGAWTPWTTVEASVARRFARGSVAVGAVGTRRFGHHDTGGIVDAYHQLWRGAYGNARAQVAREADVIPRVDVSLELFQGFPRGWEPSLGFRQMTFADQTVRIGTASVGRFVGSWYGRVRVARAWQDGDAGGTSVSGLARRYLGSTVEFVEAGLVVGGEAVVRASGASTVVDVRATTGAHVAAQRYLTDQFGGSASLALNAFEGIPTRLGGTIGVLWRW